MSITADEFRRTLGHLVAGVTVVTVNESDGRACGMTASSLTSLSLDPPMLLVCVGKIALLHDAIVRAPTFAISVLAEDQADLARYFAGRDRHEIDVTRADARRTPTGLRLLKDALAHLECARAAVYEGGDHSIVTATVEWAHARDGAPLVYFRSRYPRLAL